MMNLQRTKIKRFLRAKQLD